MQSLPATTPHPLDSDRPLESSDGDRLSGGGARYGGGEERGHLHVTERRHFQESSFSDITGLYSFGDMGSMLSFDDIRNVMQIRTSLDLGLVIRDRRRKLKLSQTELARKAGVGRQWVVAIEHGKSRAEIGLVLRTLSALDLSLMIGSGERPLQSSDGMTPVDIDAVVNAAKEDRG